MPSIREGFDANRFNNNNSLTPAANLTLKVWDVTHNVALPDVVSDTTGHVAQETLNVPVGTTIRLRIEHDGEGRAGFEEKVTYADP